MIDKSKLYDEAFSLLDEISISSDASAAVLGSPAMRADLNTHMNAIMAMSSGHPALEEMLAEEAGTEEYPLLPSHVSIASYRLLNMALLRMSMKGHAFPDFVRKYSDAIKGMEASSSSPDAAMEQLSAGLSSNAGMIAGSRASMTSFWDPNLDILPQISYAASRGLGGIEINTDSSSFNYRLLGEDMPEGYLELLNRAVANADGYGFHVNTHSPIIGQIFGKGSFIFFDPMDAQAVQMRQISFASRIHRGVTSPSYHTMHLVRQDDDAVLGYTKFFMHMMDENRKNESNVRLSIENYYTVAPGGQWQYQSPEEYMGFMDRLLAQARGDLAARGVTERVQQDALIAGSLGVTFDAGHYNLNHTEPILAAMEIADYCNERGLSATLHLTTNFGKGKVMYSAFGKGDTFDSHNRVSEPGVGNLYCMMVFLSKGLDVGALAEQREVRDGRAYISGEDADLINTAERYVAGRSFGQILDLGRKRFDGTGLAQSPTVSNDITYFILGSVPENPSSREDEYKAYQALGEYLLIRNYFQGDNGVFYNERDMSDILTRLAAASGNQRDFTEKMQGRCLEYLGTLTLDLDHKRAEESIDRFALQSSRFSKGQMLGALWNGSDVITEDYSAGEVIIAPEKKDDSIFWLESGEAHIKTSVSRDPVDTLVEGQIFGESPALYSLDRNAYVVAGTDVRVKRINPQNLPQYGDDLYRILDSDARWKHERTQQRYGEVLSLFDRCTDVMIGGSSLLPCSFSGHSRVRDQVFSSYENIRKMYIASNQLAALRLVGSVPD